MIGPASIFSISLKIVIPASVSPFNKVYSIGDAEAEVIEAQVLGTSSIAGQAVRDIKWPKDSILGAIKSDGQTKIPKGNTKLKEGAIITIFALSKDIPEIESMLQVGMDFF